MSFWEKIKQAFRSFMSGRNGGDDLARMLLWVGLIVYLLGMILNLMPLILIGMGVYIYVLFRMMSRNKAKRSYENRRYLAWRDKLRTKRKQAKARFDNRKVYKYFKCPKCKGWLRLKRGAGEVDVCCQRCKNEFMYRA